jgi:hypothetical protein
MSVYFAIEKPKRPTDKMSQGEWDGDMVMLSFALYSNAMSASASDQLLISSKTFYQPHWVRELLKSQSDEQYVCVRQARWIGPPI